MAKAQQIPSVTVILPIRNESLYIERTLKAVLAQDYPSERIEILIADGMSTDGTRQIVYQIARRTSHISIEIIDNPKHIVPTALNTALRHARREIIIRVDGHCEITSNYVRRCVQLLQEKDIAGVGGPIETVGETYVAKAIAMAMSSPFGVGGSPFRTIDDRAMLVDSVAFPAYKRETIEKAGFFDEELIRNQDDEYNYRIRKMGGKILLTPEICSRYYSRVSLGKLWKQYFQYGYWKVRVMQKHPQQMRPRQFVPPLFVLSLLVSLVLAVLSFARRTSHVAPFNLVLGTWYLIPALHLLANLAASIYTAAKRGWRTLPLLPLVYAILHLSYGFGFLVGLIRFAHRWGDKHGQVPEFDFPDNVSEI